ncbi:MAG: Nitrate reductase [Phycisphaerae bacterium]|nr:Nitrate reductase [Phycisphaerae bacterium]
MRFQPSRSWIERAAVRLGLIADSDSTPKDVPPRPPAPLRRYPDPSSWHDHVEYDAKAWPADARARHYRLIPTTCFNCESACGLLAYVDKQTGEIRKLEGNPLHPGSRGKNCAKGPATINQINDPDRVLTPMKRAGKRGDGQWQAVSWDEAIADIAGRIRKALFEKRKDEIVYHVGRPGAEGSIDRILRAWGVDGHNSHTNICSSGARLGYALWSGYDRPMPDYANARFILALNAHLESGHYFNPHAQRVMEGLSRGAKMAVVDPRLSNTASHAHYWMPCKPGTEAALILALARVVLDEGLVDRAYVERWLNWREYLESTAEPRSHEATKGEGEETPVTVDDFFAALQVLYAEFTPAYAERECGIPAKTIVEVGRLIGQAGSRFCSHVWRGAASAHLGGWQVSRCLMLLHALTGSYGTEGGCLPNAWSKYKASLINVPPPQNHWNELHWPREFPLAHYEMSFLLPHFLKDGRGKIDTYFTRVFNPVWTYPDGFTWIEALRDESKIGLHVALTPTWNETAFFADYVLPMGHGPERHDLNTYETHGATWIAFRQPVKKAFGLAEGTKGRRDGGTKGNPEVTRTHGDSRDFNPGKVWEEDEFWLALTWAVDPDGSLGIRKYAESLKTPGTLLSTDEYYAHAFERVPGLVDAAAKEGLSALEYMRKYGAFEVKKRVAGRHERVLSEAELEATTTDPATGVVRNKAGAAIGVSHEATRPRRRDGEATRDVETERRRDEAVEGFATPSRRLEFFSRTMVEWGWSEYAVPGYIPSHVYERDEGTKGLRDEANCEFVLLPTFRLPTLIHTRSGAAKWLNEISQNNPIWLHTSDAARLSVKTGDLIRIVTQIGYFVDKCWVTEGIRPGVVACSHHLGRWRRPTDPPNSRWSASVVKIEELGADGNPVPGGGRWRMRQISGPGPFESNDPDSRRVWWREGGVHQNITFPVQPDPISGMHCWHQRVRVERAHSDDRSGDVVVDTRKSMEVYREWLRRTRWPVGPEPREDGKRLRRPLWLNRPLRPTDEAYWME